MMEPRISFDNVLENAADVLMQHSALLGADSITIIRNIYGQIALVVKLAEPIAAEQKQEWAQSLQAVLGSCFSGVISDALVETPVFDYFAERRYPLPHHPGNFYFAKMGVAKHSWLREEPDQRIWPYRETQQTAENRPFVTTFYSFKGGMGRTTTLAGVAFCLAQKGKRVAIVDLDIEAPGIADILLPPSDSDGAPIAGVLDYCLGHAIGQTALTIEKLDQRIYDDTGAAGPIYVVPAGAVDRAYVEKLACLDLQQEDEESLKSALQSLLERVADETRADFILLDSRAGFHEIAGIALSSFSHAAVLFGNISGQSMAGITRAIQLIAKYNAEPDQFEERPFIAFVHGLARSVATQQGARDKSLYRDKIYDACIEEGYYLHEEDAPNKNFKNADHDPFSMQFEDNLREGIRVAEDTGATQREGILDILKSGEYMRLAGRILSWRDRS